MARISTYSVDTLSGGDQLFGTDQNGVTRNFRVGSSGSSNAGGGQGQSLVNYIIEADGRALAFLFHNSSNGGNAGLQPGTISVANNNATTAFSAVTTLKVSKFPYATAIQSNPNSALNILNEYVGERIKWSDVNNPNIYGIYECVSFAQDGETDFYDMTLAYKSGNGNFMAGDNTSTFPDVYLLELFGTDKNFTFTQASAATTWNVTHNLNKFPSVSVTLSDGTQVEAEVEHNNKNSLTITFSGDNSGIAYMN
jgi:hypothetical protein